MKIFGIGLLKTGTTSLAHALNQIGINVIHYPKSKAELFSPNNAGGLDIPVTVYYKELDKIFPKSKFIYTIRNKNEWILSVERHLKHKEKDNNIMKPWHREIRISMYGQLEFDKEKYLDVYDAHDKDVREYFREREKDLLIINVCGGEGWKQILSFLNVPIAKAPGTFPHLKTTKGLK